MSWGRFRLQLRSYQSMNNIMARSLRVIDVIRDNSTENSLFSFIATIITGINISETSSVSKVLDRFGSPMCSDAS